ncbi:hypothetical protein BGW41_003334 [Actinomortierella wolfii]|nr:hypothetical protein BGW41_003334 [Actinomortierella wolfii]
MKFTTFFTIIAMFLATVAVVMAAPPTTTTTTSAIHKPTPSHSVPPPHPTHFDGKSKCRVARYHIDSNSLIRCCRNNYGTSSVVGQIYYCRVPIGREGWYRKCIYDLYRAAVVRCTY